MNLSERLGITGVIQRIDRARRDAKVNKLIGTQSGVNVIPELVKRGRENGTVTRIGINSEFLDSIPNMYRKKVINGNELIVAGNGVHVIPKMSS